MLQNDPQTSYDNSDLMIVFLMVTLFCNDNDDQSFTFDNELYISSNLNDNQCHLLR